MDFDTKLTALGPAAGDDHRLTPSEVRAMSDEKKPTTNAAEILKRRYGVTEERLEQAREENRTDDTKPEPAADEWWMDTDQLKRALARCDLGDGYPATVRQYPHKDMLPQLTHVVPAERLKVAEAECERLKAELERFRAANKRYRREAGYDLAPDEAATQYSILRERDTLTARVAELERIIAGRTFSVDALQLGEVRMNKLQLARIENWYIGHDDRLYGEAYGHPDPKIPDGSPVITTRVVTYDRLNNRAVTQNTEYVLGNPMATNDNNGPAE